MRQVAPPREQSVYALLVRLSSEVSQMAPSQAHGHVARSVAEHYGANAVSLHRGAEGWAAAVADPRGLLRGRSALDRARLETIDARLVREVLRTDRALSALDLDQDLSSEEFVAARLGVSDVFGVPLRAGADLVGVLVLYLPLDARALGGNDFDCLSGLGEVLADVPAPGVPPLALPDPTPSAARGKGPLGLLRRVFSSSAPRA